MRSEAQTLRGPGRKRGAAGHEPGRQTDPVLPREGRGPREAVWGGQGVGRGALQPLGFRGLGDSPRPREAKTHVPLDALGDLGEGGHLDVMQSLWDLPRGKEGPLPGGLDVPGGRHLMGFPVEQNVSPRGADPTEVSESSRVGVSPGKGSEHRLHRWPCGHHPAVKQRPGSATSGRGCPCISRLEPRPGFLGPGSCAGGAGGAVDGAAAGRAELPEPSAQTPWKGSLPLPSFVSFILGVQGAL